MKPEQYVLSHLFFCFLARSFAHVLALSLSRLFFRSLLLFFVLFLASTCKQSRSLTPLASKVAIVQHTMDDDDVNNNNNNNNNNVSLNQIFHIRTSHRNISAHKARREKIKTFLLYNSNLSY